MDLALAVDQTAHPREVALGLELGGALDCLAERGRPGVARGGRSIIAFAGGGYLVGNALQNNEIRESHTEGRLAYQQQKSVRQRRDAPTAAETSSPISADAAWATKYVALGAGKTFLDC